MLQGTDGSRRRFMRLSMYAAAGTLIMSNKYYAVLQGLLSGPRLNITVPNGFEYLFGDNPKMAGILHPGINEFLQAKGVSAPSKYVSYAYKISTSIHKTITGVDREISVTHDDERIIATLDDNLLILGGPVATRLTRYFCGYKEIQLDGFGVKTIPVYDQSYPLPYAFYVGNEKGYGYWGDDYRTVKRWHEGGKEDNFRMYGICDNMQKKIIEPPTKNGYLSGDMLMIIRVPNPAHKYGFVTIIGGMHGYSIENFFSGIDKNIELFIKEINPDKYKYFQALIPFRVDGFEKVKVDLDGVGDWRVSIDKIDRDKYLSSLRMHEND
jgi:hypothetical protein